jgi:hypothetical protein
MRASVAACVLLAAVPACGYRVTVGTHDGGGTIDAQLGCGGDADCAPGNRCFCSRCVSLDLPPVRCNPECALAEHGDLCTSEGASCSRGPCGAALVCIEGSYRAVMGACDAGPEPDAGACECPPPPPGCAYDGFPCPCDHLTCAERCGRTTCSPGTFCCNDSCSLCLPPGSSCIDVICAPDCSPMDARGDGTCRVPLGRWAWNGTSCEELHGCSECVGADCPHVFASQMECLGYFGACERTCGGFAGIPCAMPEYCDYGDGSCGIADASGVCRVPPGACPPVIAPACGCDGITYASACDAAARSMSVQHDGPCAGYCDPDDAVGVGICGAIVGYAWDGARCRAISGCSCAGTDCMGVVGRDEPSCAAEHTYCPPAPAP